MQFHMRNATGKAGERLVESFVEETLHFAYRKLGEPDIGVDGEIEILDRNRDGTGGFLKVQVKTTRESLTTKRIRVAFDEAHLDYFASLTVPPIVAVVSLADRKIWWKPIMHKNNYRGSKGGFGVTLDRRADEMTRSSSLILRMIGNRSNAMIAKYLLEEVEAHLSDMDEIETADGADYVTAECWADTLRSVDDTMRDAKCLLQYERRYTDEITAIEAAFVTLGSRIEDRKFWFREHGLGDLLAVPRWTDKD